MLKFSEIPYERPDIEKLKEDMKAVLGAFNSAETYEEARAQFIAWDKIVRHTMSVSTVAQIRHSINTKDEFFDGEVEFWNRTGPELQEYSDMWTRAMCASPFRGELEKEFGEVVFINAEMELKCFDVSIIPLLQEADADHRESDRPDKHHGNQLGHQNKACVHSLFPFFFFPFRFPDLPGSIPRVFLSFSRFSFSFFRTRCFTLGYCIMNLHMWKYFCIFFSIFYLFPGGFSNDGSKKEKHSSVQGFFTPRL